MAHACHAVAGQDGLRAAGRHRVEQNGYAEFPELARLTTFREHAGAEPAFVGDLGSAIEIPAIRDAGSGSAPTPSAAPASPAGASPTATAWT